MNGNRFIRKQGKSAFTLKLNRLISAKGKNIHVYCLAGAVLVTWPLGHEQVLQGGQTISIFPKGKVCILALMDTTLRIRQNRWNLLSFSPRFEKLWKLWFQK